MAAIVNLQIEQDATFNKTFLWKVDNVAVDLTGVSATCHFKRRHNSTEIVLDASSFLSLNTPTGAIKLSIPEETTKDLNGAGVYDIRLQLTDGSAKRFIEGTWEVSPSVTKPGD